MERRKEVRLQTDEQVQVVVLGNGAKRQISGQMIEISGRGMRLIVQEPLSLDTPLKVDAGDRFYLGEVAYCRKAGEGFQIGLAVDQYLQHTPQLEMLRRSLADLSFDPESAKQR